MRRRCLARLEVGWECSLVVEHTPTRRVQDSGLDTQHGKHPLRDEQHFRSICLFACLYFGTPSSHSLRAWCFWLSFIISHRSLITGKSSSNQCLFALYQINLNIVVASVGTMLESYFSPISTYDTPVVLYSFHEGMLRI